jgi:hypothetical protein
VELVPRTLPASFLPSISHVLGLLSSLCPATSYLTFASQLWLFLEKGCSVCLDMPAVRRIYLLRYCALFYLQSFVYCLPSESHFFHCPVTHAQHSPQHTIDAWAVFLGILLNYLCTLAQHPGTDKLSHPSDPQISSCYFMLWFLS